MISSLRRRPWILIVAFFTILILAWTCVIYIANQYGPRALPISHSESIRS